MDWWGMARPRSVETIAARKGGARHRMESPWEWWLVEEEARLPYGA